MAIIQFSDWTLNKTPVIDVDRSTMGAFYPRPMPGEKILTTRLGHGFAGVGGGFSANLAILKAFLLWENVKKLRLVTDKGVCSL